VNRKSVMVLLSANDWDDQAAANHPSITLDLIRRSRPSFGSGLMFVRVPDVGRPVALGHQAECLPQTCIDLLEKGVRQSTELS
jgi:hypothetical protein